MKRIRRTWSAALRGAALIGLAALGLSCARVKLAPIPNRDLAALSADDVAKVMRRAGFSDKQILKSGARVHDLLAQNGAAQIWVGPRTEAILATDGPYLHVATRQRGPFVYNWSDGSFR